MTISKLGWKVDFLLFFVLIFWLVQKWDDYPEFVTKSKLGWKSWLFTTFCSKFVTISKLGWKKRLFYDFLSQVGRLVIKSRLLPDLKSTFSKLFLNCYFLYRHFSVLQIFKFYFKVSFISLLQKSAFVACDPQIKNNKLLDKKQG